MVPPPPRNPKLVGVEFIINPSSDLWERTAKLVYETEGWFYSNEDFPTWLKCFGKEDFRLALAIDTKKDEIIGCVSASLFQPEDEEDEPPLVTVGNYFVTPKFRKVGLGTELWERVFDDSRFHTATNMGLVSVETMTDKYAKKGFDKIPDTRIVCARALISDLQPDNLQTDTSLSIYTFDNAILELGIDAITDFDARMNGGIRRERFLKGWFRAKNSVISHVACNSDREIVGFISIRTSVASDITVAPLYATSELIASTLLRTAIEHVDDINQYRYIYFHPLTTNTTARKIYVKLTVGTCVSVATYTPQFTGRPLEVNNEKIFSVTDIGTCALF